MHQKAWRFVWKFGIEFCFQNLKVFISSRYWVLLPKARCFPLKFDSEFCFQELNIYHENSTLVPTSKSLKFITISWHWVFHPKYRSFHENSTLSFAHKIMKFFILYIFILFIQVFDWVFLSFGMRLSFANKNSIFSPKFHREFRKVQFLNENFFFSKFFFQNLGVFQDHLTLSFVFKCLMFSSKFETG